MNIKIWLLIVALLAIALGFGWYMLGDPPQQAASLSEAPVPKVEPLSWHELKASAEFLEARELREHGVRIFQEGDPDRAFLLFKTAAKKGDGWSALAAGEMYDPATFAAVDFTPSKTAFSKPNPGKALSWYDQALKYGEERARPLRERLVVYLEQAAAQGDAKARRILQRAK